MKLIKTWLLALVYIYFCIGVLFISIHSEYVLYLFNFVNYLEYLYRVFFLSLEPL